MAGVMTANSIWLCGSFGPQGGSRGAHGARSARCRRRASRWSCAMAQRRSRRSRRRRRQRRQRQPSATSRLAGNDSGGVAGSWHTVLSQVRASPDHGTQRSARLGGSPGHGTRRSARLGRPCVFLFKSHEAELEAVVGAEDAAEDPAPAPAEPRRRKTSVPKGSTGRTNVPLERREEVGGERALPDSCLPGSRKRLLTKSNIEQAVETSAPKRGKSTASVTTQKYKPQEIAEHLAQRTGPCKLCRRELREGEPRWKRYHMHPWCGKAEKAAEWAAASRPSAPGSDRIRTLAFCFTYRLRQSRQPWKISIASRE